MSISGVTGSHIVMKFFYLFMDAINQVKDNMQVYIRNWKSSYRKVWWVTEVPILVTYYLYQENERHMLCVRTVTVLLFFSNFSIIFKDFLVVWIDAGGDFSLGNFSVNFSNFVLFSSKITAVIEVDELFFNDYFFAVWKKNAVLWETL